jgi:hypothetical protein
MPLVTSAAVYTAQDTGFEMLAARGHSVGIGFSGSTLATTVQVGYVDEGGTFVPMTDGTIQTLPTNIIVDSVPPNGLALNVVGGSPNFYMNDTGKSGRL